MAIFDQASRQRLFDQISRSLDDDNARDMETFARAFLHNGALWDAIAEHYPTAPASAVKAIMLEAFAARQAGRG